MADFESSSWKPQGSKEVAQGTVLGPYTVEKLIGRGGMSEVWRAKNETTGDTVALKVLHIFFGSDDDRREIMQREASLNNLKHPSIVQYHELLESESGQLVLAMEYLEGIDLEAASKDQSFDETSAKKLLYQLASGLAAAHDAGVVHRDISPDNVIMRNGNRECPVIIDFGVAVHRVDAAKTILGGQFAGKFTYAAYEQFEGIADQRTDIYALGLVALYALSGRHAFSSMSIIETIESKRRQIDTTEIPLSIRSVIDRMCAPLPEDRFQTMHEVLTALENSKPSLPRLPKQPMPGDDAVLIDGQLALSKKTTDLGDRELKRVLDTLRFECQNFLNFGGVANTSPLLHNSIRFFAETAVPKKSEEIDEVDFGLQVEGLREKFNFMRATLEEENPERVGFILSIISVAERLSAELHNWHALQQKATDFQNAANVDTLQTSLLDAAKELEKRDDIIQPPLLDRLKDLLDNGSRTALFAAVSLLSNMARAVFVVFKLTANEAAKTLAKTYAAPLSAVAAGSVGAMLFKLADISPSMFGWLRPWIDTFLKLVG